MEKLRYGIESYLPSIDVVEAPTPVLYTAHNPAKALTVAPGAVTVITPEPVLTTVQAIGIEAGVALAGETIQTVNARNLHSFLQSGKDFSTWIKDRIEKYGFKGGVDFTTVNDSPNSGNQTRGGDRRSIDYHVSLDMAKELAMLERTDKGRGARQYFIECEKKMMEVAPQADDRNKLLS